MVRLDIHLNSGALLSATTADATLATAIVTQWVANHDNPGTVINEIARPDWSADIAIRAVDAQAVTVQEV